MKFIISGYTPQTGDPERENYPQSLSDFSKRTKDIRSGNFETVRKELGPLRRFGDKSNTDLTPP